MAPQQYVQKPYKVRAEQYAAAANPPAPGICHCTVTVLFPTGLAHVHTTIPPGVFAPAEGDWIVQELWSPYGWLILPPAEFADRFGGQPAVEE